MKIFKLTILGLFLASLAMKVVISASFQLGHGSNVMAWGMFIADLIYTLTFLCGVVLFLRWLLSKIIKRIKHRQGDDE